MKDPISPNKNQNRLQRVLHLAVRGTRRLLFLPFEILSVLQTIPALTSRVAELQGSVEAIAKQVAELQGCAKVQNENNTAWFESLNLSAHGIFSRLVAIDDFVHRSSYEQDCINKSLTSNDTVKLGTLIQVLETLQRIESSSAREAKPSPSGFMQSNEITLQLAELEKEIRRTRALRQIDQELQKQELSQIKELRVRVANLERSISESSAASFESASNINSSRAINVPTFQVSSIAPSVRPENHETSAASPEHSLLSFLFPFLKSRVAIDVGAHHGEVSTLLADAGYDVFAIEPHPENFKVLEKRSNGQQKFRAANFAVGASNGIAALHQVVDKGPGKPWRDVTKMGSLVKHSLPEDLDFSDSVEVKVCTLSSLVQTSILSPDISVLKIDTEGFDLEVIRGMGDLRPQVIVAEFWGSEHPLGKTDTLYRLKDLVTELRKKDYFWNITMYSRNGSHEVSFHSCMQQEIPDSWGNCISFHDRETFLKAEKWCSTLLPTTYFCASTKDYTTSSFP